LGGAQTYEPGSYEGVIEFNGEEGYTRARENRVAQLPAWLVFSSHGFCGSGYGETSGPGEPGARLRGVSFAGGRSLSFQVNKNSPKARTVFTASLKERLGGIRIDRALSGEASPNAFSFGQNLRTATLSPPAPFSGSASLSRSKNSFSAIWTGDLALDFPGRAAVSLAGGDVHVSLRVDLPSRHDAVGLSAQLRQEGLPAVRRWKYLLVGATDEDSAKTLAERIRNVAPSGSRVTVEGTWAAAYADRAPSPFAVLGGLGS
jgi:hypothetical protein